MFDCACGEGRRVAILLFDDKVGADLSLEEGVVRRRILRRLCGAVMTLRDWVTRRDESVAKGFFAGWHVPHNR